MPYKIVKNKIAINNYLGVTVYNIYKDDKASNNVRENIYTLYPYGEEGSDETFDIRDLVADNMLEKEDANGRPYSNEWFLCRLIEKGVIVEPSLKTPQNKNAGGDTFYTPDPSRDFNIRDGVCPICGCVFECYNTPNNVYEGEFELTPDGRDIWYHYTCPQCGVEGKEEHDIVFSGFRV